MNYFGSKEKISSSHVHINRQFLNLTAQEVNNLHEFHPNPEEEDLDLPLFDWLTVASATNDFLHIRLVKVVLALFTG